MRKTLLVICGVLGMPGFRTGNAKEAAPAAGPSEIDQLKEQFGAFQAEHDALRAQFDAMAAENAALKGAAKERSDRDQLGLGPFELPAGVDVKDVLWRKKAGLDIKLAVQAALLQKKHDDAMAAAGPETPAAVEGKESGEGGK